MSLEGKQLALNFTRGINSIDETNISVMHNHSLHSFFKECINKTVLDVYKYIWLYTFINR